MDTVALLKIQFILSLQARISSSSMRCGAEWKCWHIGLGMHIRWTLKNLAAELGDL